MSKKRTIPSAAAELGHSVNVGTEHPDYTTRLKEWKKMRICMKGEAAIKEAAEDYLPRPSGMTDEYADAYDQYLERAHFPLICPYALAGVLGVIITKLPEFNFPKELEYLHKAATKDGRGVQQLLLDVIVEIFQTGRVPLVVDIHAEKNEFRIVQYKAEDLTNWKSAVLNDDKSFNLAVIKQKQYLEYDPYSHATKDIFRAMHLEKGKYIVRTYDINASSSDVSVVQPKYLGVSLTELPIVVAGSISNSPDIQPIPLIPVANCSIQIYRKEADLANSEFLSCNPTLVISGASNDDDLPNVVGSSVMIVIPDSQGRVYYTKTDTAALQHIKTHIDALYEEAIRHGVAILDSRKGVEAAEALRIRQATQSASLYSIYLSALTAIKKCVLVMCKWGGFDEEKVVIDAPSSLTFGIPDATVMQRLVEGFGVGIIPLPIIHRYLIASGLLDQTVSLTDYIKLIEENEDLKKRLKLEPKPEVKQVGQGPNPADKTDENSQNTSDPAAPKVPKETKKAAQGPQNTAK